VLPSHPSWEGSESERGCPKLKTKADDEVISKCLHYAGVDPTDTRDDGRERFLNYGPRAHFDYPRHFNIDDGWYWKGKPASTRSGLDCCSAQPISWHSLKPVNDELKDMYLFDYLLDFSRVGRSP
jgi:hypothetical protein